MFFKITKRNGKIFAFGTSKEISLDISEMNTSLTVGDRSIIIIPGETMLNEGMTDESSEFESILSTLEEFLSANSSDGFSGNKTLTLTDVIHSKMDMKLKIEFKKI